MVEILLDVVAYNIGYFFTKLITGGKYPKEYLKDGGSTAIDVIGIFVFLGVVIPVFYIFFK
jgi:hypothetical protein